MGVLSYLMGVLSYPMGVLSYAVVSSPILPFHSLPRHMTWFHMNKVHRSGPEAVPFAMPWSRQLGLPRQTHLHVANEGLLKVAIERGLAPVCRAEQMVPPLGVPPFSTWLTRERRWLASAVRYELFATPHGEGSSSDSFPCGLVHPCSPAKQVDFVSRHYGVRCEQKKMGDRGKRYVHSVGGTIFSPAAALLALVASSECLAALCSSCAAKQGFTKRTGPSHYCITALMIAHHPVASWVCSEPFTLHC